MPKNERKKIRHLLVIKDLQGQRTIPLQEVSYSLGRDLRNTIVLCSRSVSRQHAILLRITVPETNQYTFRIIDGSFKGKRSTNGLFVNGAKCFSHDLIHGDVIEFGSNQVRGEYYTIANISERMFSEFCEVEDISKLIFAICGQRSSVCAAPPKGLAIARTAPRGFQKGNPFPVSETDEASVPSEQLEARASEANPNPTHPSQTLIFPYNLALKGASEVTLARLASFPELIPNPIIEIDLHGSLTYLNPAAALKFPNLRETGQQHPILAGLLSAVENDQENSFVREVEVDGKVFEQSIHYLAESDLIRTFIVREMTQQKQVEAELCQRDCLLQAVAEATNYLLAELNYEKAIDKALAVLGKAAQAHRVYLFENNLHPVTNEMVVNLKFEWTCSNHEPSVYHWQDDSAQAFGLVRWKTALESGKSVSGLTRELPTAEQELLIRCGIQSLLLVPLRLDEKLWGYLGLADCCCERRWSKHEESTLLAMATSISGAKQRQQVEERICYQALHDLLTELPNRLLFNELLSNAIPNAKRNDESLAVIFLDLDEFKSINDSLGHTQGDQLLRSVAKRLRDALRAGDTVARWGGDEFTILLPRIHQVEEVIHVARRILQAFENAFYLEGNEFYVTASLGIALFNDDSSDAETLIKHADAALYQAKDAGKNNYQFYNASLSVKTPKLLNMEKSLRHALEREELVLYYQPRVNIATGKITGMEALLRWQHPEMGLVAPNVFIPLAEESGLIIPIGEWVLQTACKQNKIWQEAGLPSLTIAVNLSLKQFRQPKLVETVAMILEQTGLEPRFLELEITETTAIEDLYFTESVLQKLENMGVRLSIDDFGTGHSSLSRLQLLPLHNLKIDRSFIQNLTTDTKVAHIVKAIVALGRSLGLRLTAEGVEKEEELEFLKSIHCEDVQGFLFYRPLPAEKATEILLHGSTTS